MATAIKNILRVITSSLQIPAIVILLLLIALAVFMIGSLIVEFFSDRRRLNAKIPEIIDDIQGMNADQLDEYFQNCGLLKRQKKAIHELITRTDLPNNSREALARELLFEEQNHYEKVTKITDVVARIAPMFGLMGTLIPLGPGLIGLGQGDTKTLSESLLIAFDTTVAGLISGAVAFVISAIRKNWYDKYAVGLETILECILDVQDKAGKGTTANVPANSPEPVKAAVAQAQAAVAQAQAAIAQAAEAPAAGKEQ